MILGTGIDVIEVDRIQKAAAKASFYQGVFTQGEQAFLQAHGNAPCQMAGLFAAKEAVSKALGTGFSQGIGPRDIEICHRESGAPYAVLHGAAEKRRKELGGRIHVSVSHIPGHCNGPGDYGRWKRYWIEIGWPGCWGSGPRTATKATMEKDCCLRAAKGFMGRR